MAQRKKHSKKPKRSQVYRQILHKQVIDETQPGTILRDLESVLQFVHETAPTKVTGRYHLFPLKTLHDINALFTHPLQLALKRPQQKSYLNILGVYWLLRTSGLLRLEGSGVNNQVVIVDETVYNSWQNLNPTERYCVLLETWLLRAQLEVIGEQHGAMFGGPFYQWATFFEQVPKQGLDIADNPEHERMLKYHPGYYNISLLWLFGFITLQDALPEPEKGWRILNIAKTLLGEAIMQVLYEKHMMTHDLLLFDEHDILATIGTFQPKLQPFFPEWQHNLTRSLPESQSGTYSFKVSLGSPWRRIAIPGEMVWDTLSRVILDAFNFDYDHLYQFIYTDHFGIERYLNHPYMEEYPFADEVKIQDVFLQPGTSLVFFYDFGDSWKFRVNLEQIAPLDATFKRPKIVEKHGKAPEQYRW